MSEGLKQETREDSAVASKDVAVEGAQAEKKDEISELDGEIDLTQAMSLLEQADDETAALETAVVKASFSKKDYEDLLKKRDEIAISIQEVAKQYEDQIYRELDSYQYPFDLEEFNDDLFVLNEITKDENYKNQEVLNIIRKIFDYERRILSSEKHLGGKNDEEIKTAISKLKELMNGLVASLKPLIEKKRALLKREYAEAHNRFQREKYEIIRRPLQSAHDRIRNYKKILKEIREKLSDPIIKARIQVWEEQEALDSVLNQMNEISKFMEDRKFAVEKIAQIQQRIIEKLLSLMKIPDEKKEELREQIEIGNITMDVNEIRASIASGILTSPKKVELGEIVPWRTGGKYGERYYDLLNQLNQNSISEEELQIYLENPNLEIDRGRTAKGEYEKATGHIDLVEKINKINRALKYIIGEQEYFDRTSRTNKKGLIYQAVESRATIKDEDFSTFLENLNKNAERIAQEKSEREKKRLDQEEEKLKIFETQLEGLEKMGAIEFAGYLVVPEINIPKRGPNKDKKGVSFKIFFANQLKKTVEELPQISITGSRLRAGENYYESTIPDELKYLLE